MKKWVKTVTIKTIKTMAQCFCAVTSTTALITDVNWRVVLSTSLMSGLMCIMMNISAIEEVE